MRYRIWIAVGVLLAGVAATTVYAALIGITNSTLPITKFSNTSSVTYIASSGALTVTATPTNTTFANASPNGQLALFSGTRSMAINVRVNSDGTLAGGVAGDDFVFTGNITDPYTSINYNGTLLTGEIVEFGYLDGGVGFGDQFDFRFRPTGGLLFNYYLNKDIGVIVGSDNGNTFAGVFTVDFGGNAKGMFGPIPAQPGSFTGRVGNFVFYDKNGNGLQDFNEPGLNGVPVTLTPATGPSVTIQTGNSPTGQPGYYQFTGLGAGTYTVSIVSPNGFSPTIVGAGSDADEDSNPNPATVILPTQLSSDQSIDFGLLSPNTGALGDFVWSDTNGNGIQETGEPGLSNVIVQLLDSTGTAVLATTTTNNVGFYGFYGLPEGTYKVLVTKPTGYAFSPTGAGTTQTDSNADQTTGVSTVFLPQGITDLTIDVGLVPPNSGAIGDFVWNDLNANGIQDSGEPGINGVRVRLFDGMHNQIGDTYTTTYNGQAGYYEFTGLGAGNYDVHVTRPTAYAQFSPTGMGTAATDSNGSPSQDGLSSIVLVRNLPTNSTVDHTIDFGFYNANATGKIGNFVWNDLDRDGIQDAGEPGIPGVLVELRDSIGTSLGVIATTDSTGAYLFTGLKAGTYEVKVLGGVPPQFNATTVNAAGSTTSNDSNKNPSTVVLATDASQDLTIDFGYVVPPVSSLSGFVYADTSNDGVKDSGESGIGGATVTLTGVNDLGQPVLTTTTTAADGSYTFGNLRAGTYTITETQPLNYLDGKDTIGTPGGTTTNDQFSAIVLGAGVTGVHNNFGELVPSSLSGFVYVDLDDDGVKDLLEVGIPNTTVTLVGINDLGPVTIAMTTGGDGSYTFSDLRPGVYAIIEVQPLQYLDGKDTVGSLGGQITNDEFAVIVLGAGVNGTDNDFGEIQLGKIGDYVWNDLNHNGVQDDGPTGIGGVTVTLAGPGGTQSTTTDASGFYQFTNLVAGNYTVTAGAPPAGFVSTLTGAGTAATDSNGSPATVVLAPGASEQTIDFGFWQPAKLGDYVWLDKDGNGQQDGGENGIAGVTVHLLDGTGTTVLQTTTTDVNGLYGFGNLVPGTYVVQFVTPAGAYSAFTTADVGADGTDSDANAVTGKTGAYVVAPGDNIMTVDAGLLPIDLSVTKTVDNAAPMVGSNVVFTVTVSNAAGLSTATNVTVADVLPAGLAYVSSTVSQGSYSGGTWTVGTLASPATATLTITATVTTGGTKTNYTQVTTADQVDRDSTPNNNPGPTPSEDDEAAASLTPKAHVGDYVWLDKNGNGRQDSGEPVIAGVTVNLLDGTGTTVLQTTTTNGSGLYGFDVAPGTYVVQFVTPAGAYDTFTTADNGSDVSDSDANPATGKTAPYTLASGDNNLTVDAGLLPIDLSVTKTVNNAAPTVGSNVVFTVTVSNAAGLSTATNVTVADVLPAGLAYVSSSATLGSYASGVWTVGTLASPATATLTITATVTTGGTKTNYTQVTTADQVDRDSAPNNNPGPTPSEDDEAAASLTPKAHVGDYVWLDKNGNGQQDSGEPVIAGVTVNLLDSTGTTVLQTTTTNGSGLYGFDVAPGTYVVQFVTPAGAYDTFTTADSGSDVSDSDVNPATGKTGPYTLASGDNNLTVDAGLLPIDLSVTKTVNNAAPTVGSNVVFTVTVSNAAGLSTATNVTVADVLPAGLAYVSSSATLGSYASGGWTVGTLASPATATLTITATVTTGGTKTNYTQVTTADQVDRDSTPNDNPGPTPSDDDEAAVSLTPPASLGNHTWVDSNANGKQDAGEPGLNGVLVTLTGAGPDGIFGNSDDTTATQTTTNDGVNDGAYKFTNLPPGQYKVTFAAVGGYTRTVADNATDAVDSDANAATGATGTYTLASGQYDDTVDAGYYQPASLGNYTWIDSNANGRQDAGEPGLNGVLVTLTGAGPDGIFGNGDDTTATQTTANDGINDGAYKFTNLAPGPYKVTFAAVGGYTRTVADNATDAVDSDANAATGATGTYTLTSGQYDDTVDAGYYQLASLSGYVYVDANDDGVKQSTETPIAGVTVTLTGTNVNGLMNLTTTTNAAGLWSFPNLVPGSYAVAETQPSTYLDGKDTIGTPGSSPPFGIQSDDTFSSITLTGGVNGLNNNFGELQPATLGDYVWLDKNGNGQQNGGEPGIAGVTVRLLDNTGTTTLQTTTTDGSGFYSFTVAPGTYVVQFVTPAGVYDTFTTANTGADASDSDAGAATGKTGTYTVGSGETNLTIDAGLLPIDLSVTKSVNNPTPTVGSNVVFTVTVSNAAGQSTATNVTVADALPAGLAYVSSTVTQGSYAANTWTVGTLASPATATLTITATVTTGGVKTNYAQVTTADQLDKDSTPNNNPGPTPSEDDEAAVTVTPSAHLGDVVWLDQNANGQQDSGEPGIAGVTVKLRDSTGATVLQTTTTNASGLYGFDVAPGTYRIEFATPSGLSASPADLGNDVSDSDSAGGVTGTYTLNSGDSDLTVDAGFYQLASLAGYVYVDANNDGVQQGTEAPIAGVTVKLTGTDGSGGAVSLTTTTDASGLYSFANLVPGTYVVSETQPAGYFDGKDTIGTPGGGTANDVFSAIVLAAGANGVNNNFGELEPASLGQFVWLDKNGNGQQDSGEPGIPGVTVRLLDSTGTNVLQTTTTDANGLYGFDLAPGTYVVQFMTPAGTYDKFTLVTAGPSVTDSDANLLTGKSAPYTVVSGQDLLTIDAGLLPIDLSVTKTVNNATPVVFSNVVFTVTVSNAAGLSTATGVTVADILPAGVTYVSSTATQGSYGGGLWTVGTLASPATATLTITATVATGGAKTNYTQVNSADQLDRDSSPNNNAGPIPSEDDEAAVTVTPPAHLGDFVWLDRDGDGQQDGGEPGIAGVTVRLLDSTGTNVLRTTATDVTGLYGFDVAPGTYVLQFVAPAGAYDTFTSANVGIDATDSDAGLAGKTGPIAIASGDNNLTIDAGLLPIDLSVTKTVNNATPSVGSNVVFTVTVSNASGLSTATGVTLTDVLPSGLTYVSSTATQGSLAGSTWTVGTLASPATATLTITATVTTTGTKTNYVQVASAGQIDRDSTVNNNPGPTPTEDDEAAASLTPLQPLTAACAVATSGQVGVPYSSPITVTGGTAPYTFALASGTLPGGLTLNATTGVISGTPTTAGTFAFTVKVTDSTTPTHLTFTTPGCGITIVTSTVTGLVCGDTATIGYWHNKNGQSLILSLNGGPTATNLATWLAANFPYLYGANAGVNNLTGKTNNEVAALFMTFFNQTGSKTDAQVLAGALASYATNSTLAGGTSAVAYGFNVSTSGTGAKVYNVGSYGTAIGLTNSTTYTVLKLLQQANLRKQQGAFDANAFNAIFDGINVGGDLGNCAAPTTSLSGYVYVDANNDGVKQSTETPIAGVTVTVTGTDVDNAVVNRTTTTSAAGLWSFPNLVPGTYTVTETQPVGYLDGKDTQGTPGTGTAGNDVFTSIMLNPGVNGVNNNFGELSTTPALTIIKKTNGTDNDSIPGPTVTVGSTVTWTYVVTNAGNVTLTNVTVTDDRIGAICTVATLAAGASTTCTKTGIAVAGQYTNTGTVTGTPPVGPNVTASNVDHYFGQVPPLTASCASATTGTTGVAYSSSITASGGTAPYTFALATGALPGSLTLAPTTGVISGTPTTTGTFSFTVKVTDSTAGTPLTFTTGSCGITIASPVGTIGTGDTATIGFWQNKNGQALIKAVNGSATATNLGNWLATNYPSLYGAGSSYNLAGKTNTQVAARFVTVFNGTSPKTEAQVMAGAIAVYVTNSTLAGGTYAARYGFTVSSGGTAVKTYNVGTYGTAIGLSNNTTYTIAQLLQQAALRKQQGLFDANAFNVIFDAINTKGDIK